MTIYRNMRNDKLAELLNCSGNSATMRLLDTNETIEVGLPTLKRWWKPVSPFAQETAFAEYEIAPEINNAPGPSYKAQVIPPRAPEPETTSPADTDPSTADDRETQALPIEPTLAPVEPEANNEGDNKGQDEKPSAEPLKLSEVVHKLEALFDTLNAIYYEDKLPRPVITIQSTPKFYGHCSTKQIWKSEHEAMYEINIGAEFLNRPKENTAATLQHEMVHLYCRVNNIDETCQKGRYHNKIFKAEAEARGLIIGYNRTIGYSPTEPSEEFKQKLQEAGFDLSVPFCRETVLAKRTADREKSHKYVCSVCGQSVRSTSILNIVCGDCDAPMTRKD